MTSIGGGGSTVNTELFVEGGGKPAPGVLAAEACWGGWVHGDQVLSLARAGGGGEEPILRFWL